MRSGMRIMLKLIAAILQQKAFPGIPARAIASLMNGNIIPSFAPVMPRDQAAIVDEVVKLLATDPPGISLETAQKVLGRGFGEVSRIAAMIADEKLWKAISMAKQQSELRKDEMASDPKNDPEKKAPDKEKE